MTFALSIRRTPIPPAYHPLVRTRLPAPLPVILAAILLVVAPPAWSQESTISGRVTDEQGRPLAGATVAVLGTPLSTGTTDSGRYALRLDAGRLTNQEVTLQARAIGRTPPPATCPAGTTSVK